MTKIAFLTVLPAIFTAIAIAAPVPGSDQSNPGSRGAMMPKLDRESGISVVEWEEPKTHRPRPSIFHRPNTPRLPPQTENNNNNNIKIEENKNNGHRGMMMPRLDRETGASEITFGSDSDSSSSSSDEEEQIVQIHGSKFNKKEWDNILREMQDDDDEDEIMKARQESSRIRAGIHGKKFDRNMGEKKW